MSHTYISGIPGTPASSGAYTPAVVAGDLCFLSGQSPVDPQTGELVGDTPAEQARQTISNIFALLEAAGFTPSNLVSMTVLLSDLAYWGEVNEAYAAAFEGLPLPTRMMVEAGAVPPEGAFIEIQAIASRASG